LSLGNDVLSLLIEQMSTYVANNEKEPYSDCYGAIMRWNAKRMDDENRMIEEDAQNKDQAKEFHSIVAKLLYFLLLPIQLPREAVGV
jgi:hypothetical protein